MIEQERTSSDSVEFPQPTTRMRDSVEISPFITSDICEYDLNQSNDTSGSSLPGLSVKRTDLELHALAISFVPKHRLTTVNIPDGLACQYALVSYCSLFFGKTSMFMVRGP